MGLFQGYMLYCTYLFLGLSLFFGGYSVWGAYRTHKSEWKQRLASFLRWPELLFWGVIMLLLGVIQRTSYPLVYPGLDILWGGVLILSVAHLSGRLWPRYGRYLGPILALTAPDLFIESGSSSFVLVEVTILLLVLKVVQTDLRHPSPNSLSVVLWSSMLLSFIAGWSVLFYWVAILMTIGIGLVRGGRRPFHWSICLTPFALSAAIWSWGTPDDWMGSLGNLMLMENTKVLLEVLFNLEAYSTGSSFVSVLFLAALAFYFFQNFLRKPPLSQNQRSDYLVYKIFGAALLLRVLHSLALLDDQSMNANVTSLVLQVTLFQILFLMWAFSRMRWSRMSLSIFAFASVSYFFVAVLPRFV